MKRIFSNFYTLIIVLLVALSGCKDSGSPQSITELFLISINKFDFETAHYVSTKNTKAFLKILEAESKGKLTQAQLDKRAEELEIKIIKTELTSDTTATVFFNTKPSLLPFDRLHLKLITEKLDKKSWKIDLSTIEIYEQINNSGTEPHQEGPVNTGQFHPDADSVAVPE